MKNTIIFRLLIACGLLLSVLYSANLTLFNWWASGGPPNDFPQIYYFRGNVFFVLTIGLFISFVIVALKKISPKGLSIISGGVIVSILTTLLCLHLWNPKTLKATESTTVYDTKEDAQLKNRKTISQLLNGQEVFVLKCINNDDQGYPIYKVWLKNKNIGFVGEGSYKICETELKFPFVKREDQVCKAQSGKCF